MSKLYVAYGSNLNLLQMGRRCPTAKVIGIGFIRNYKLTFRGVATIEQSEKQEVPVAVWKIEKSDEIALDKYEGFPSLYRKEWVDVELKDKTVNAMVYIMNRGNPHMPSTTYLEKIRQGYEDCGLDLLYLKEAIKDTQDRILKKIVKKFKKVC